MNDQECETLNSRISELEGQLRIADDIIANLDFIVDECINYEAEELGTQPAAEKAGGL